MFLHPARTQRPAVAAVASHRQHDLRQCRAAGETNLAHQQHVGGASFAGEANAPRAMAPAAVANPKVSRPEPKAPPLPPQLQTPILMSVPAPRQGVLAVVPKAPTVTSMEVTCTDVTSVLVHRIFQDAQTHAAELVDRWDVQSRAREHAIPVSEVAYVAAIADAAAEIRLSPDNSVPSETWHTVGDRLAARLCQETPLSNLASPVHDVFRHAIADALAAPSQAWKCSRGGLGSYTHAEKASHWIVKTYVRTRRVQFVTDEYDPTHGRPLIFLDIDGVLREDIKGPYNQDAVAAVVKLAKSTPAHIVISSSWAKHYPLDHFTQHPQLGPYIVGKTVQVERPYLILCEKPAGTRSRQILVWLSLYGPKVPSFVS